MISTYDQQSPIKNTSFNDRPVGIAASARESAQATLTTVNSISNSTATLLPSGEMTHHPQAGLNSLVDAAGYLFSVIGKLKQIKSYRYLSKLQKELIREINAFQATIKNHGYNAEYALICRYVLCATFDDIITNTTWGNQSKWDAYSLLHAYEQSTHHQDKFFVILERVTKEPTFYIDLMELMYICLSLGYKGPYRTTEHSQYQLEQITNHLYNHIRVYRGNFNKTLSPAPIKPYKIIAAKVLSKKASPSIPLVLSITICVIAIIFIGLGHLMDTISNEAYKNVSSIKNPISSETV
jgi:type VI secretion system protein ImpK